MSFFFLFTAHLAAQQPQQPLPQFRAGIDLVQVDVSVLDRNGKPVLDLVAADFDVREKDGSQRVDTIYLVAPMPPPVPSGSPAPEATSPAAAATPVPRRPLPPRVFVFVFDMAHLSAAGFTRSRSAIQGFLGDGLRAGDLAGLVVNGNMLGNRIVSEKKVLLDLLKLLGPPNLNRFTDMQRWPRLLTEEEALRIARGDEAALKTALTRACNDQSGACDKASGTGAIEAELSSKSVLVATESARDAQTTLTVLQTLANGLGRFPGPKHVVFFSEGFYTGDFAERVTQVSGLAARNNVRVSTLDARGLNTDPRMQNLMGESPTVGTSDLTALGSDTYADVLTTLALETGGERVRNRNNLRPALDRIADISATFYVLGYTPTTAFDGSYRSIEVKVKRPGLTVVARRGYVATRMTPGPGREDLPAVPPATPPPTAAPVTALAGSATSIAAAIPATPPTSAETISSTPVLRIRPGGNPDTRAVADRLTGTAAATAEGAGELAKEGWNLYAAGKVEEARDRLAAASAAGAGIWSDYALGLAEFTLRHAQAAVTAWQRVRAAEPTYQPVYFDLADAYLQLGRSSDALAVLRDAARRWPKDAETHNAVGVVLVSRSALDDAIAAFERAVASAPDDGLGHFNLGRAHHLRYVYRLRSVGNNNAARSLADADRQKAISSYKRCLTLGGSFAPDAKDALAALEWNPRSSTIGNR